MTAAARDRWLDEYLAQLPYPPYAVQEEALLAWFTSDHGVLVCAPTGTGKTLIAQAALFEALKTGQQAYYTTPLIALTEQKFREMQDQAEAWGFTREHIGLVTGNRRVNPRAPILIVVAEILLNRLLNQEEFDFSHVAAVVMDEFHSFGDVDRGIVWELSLALLPKHIRLLLLSATIGNAAEFIAWLERCHGRPLELVEGRERKVPLTYHWVPDQFLPDLLTRMCEGPEEARQTPALVFCFNRDDCWNVADTLKGVALITGARKTELNEELALYDWKEGAGPKLKQLLVRGVGVHHAGVLPKYRRLVEGLFVRRLLGVVVCTETLAAGINLPARSVVLTSLVKGPFGKQRMVDPSIAHQIFGRAGRPQFDTKGYVFALAHEDDVKLNRWREKYNAIPDNTKDPGLLKVKKDLERKKPCRRDNQTYWNEDQFVKLRNAPPNKLASRGPLPWRLLAYLLQKSPEVDRIRSVVRKRLLDEGRIKGGLNALDRMLLSLAEAGFVVLEPTPPQPAAGAAAPEEAAAAKAYSPILAKPTPELEKMFKFRSIHPIYAVFLLKHLGLADRAERLQALESVLELPKALLKFVRVPFPEDLPPGPLATTRLDPELVARGLITVKAPPAEGAAEDDEEDDDLPPERPPTLADKLHMLFQATHPDVGDLTVQSVWCAGDLLSRFSGDFNKLVKSRDLIKQEGLIFRHFLRLILLCGEFAQAEPADGDPAAWRADLHDIMDQLTATCRAVDPSSTDEAMEQLKPPDTDDDARPLV